MNLFVCMYVHQYIYHIMPLHAQAETNIYRPMLTSEHKIPISITTTTITTTNTRKCAPLRSADAPLG